MGVGKSWFRLAKDEKRSSVDKFPMHRAAMWAHTESLRSFLDSGMSPNSRDDEGFTPLHYAVYCGTKDSCCRTFPKVEAIKLLIERGACVDATDYLDSCPDVMTDLILRDVDLCAQAIVNQFNNKSLPALYCLPGFDQKLPHIKTLKINSKHSVASDVEAYVASEIQTKSFCNPWEARPVVLKMMCVSCLINYKF